MLRSLCVWVLLPLTTWTMSVFYGSGLVDRMRLRYARRWLQRACIPSPPPSFIDSTELPKLSGVPRERKLRWARVTGLGKPITRRPVHSLVLDADTGLCRDTAGNLYSPRVIDWRKVA